MLHLRLIAPADSSEAVVHLLREHPGVAHLSVFPGAGQQPDGDLVMADVAREAADDVLAELKQLGVAERGSIAVEQVDLSLSAAAERAEADAPGEGAHTPCCGTTCRHRRGRSPRSSPTSRCSRSPRRAPGSPSCSTPPSSSSAP